jgi:PTS system nitrogen regulatory IIA component
MKLSELLKPEYIIADLKAHDKKGVLEELAQVITDHEPSLSKGALLQVLLERERLGSTGIGDGIALPHGKLKELDHLCISLGRSMEGLDFDSIDEKPVYVFFSVAGTREFGGHASKGPCQDIKDVERRQLQAAVDGCRIATGNLRYGS